MRRREFSLALGALIAGCMGDSEETEPDEVLGDLDRHHGDTISQSREAVETVREVSLYDPDDHDYTNPYGGIEWSSIGRHKGQFHVHPHYGDIGPPQTVYDRYVELGYDVINIQPKSHLRFGKPWPLERMGGMHPEWENRFPTEDRVIAIPGVEYDDPQHLTGLFTEVMLRDIKNASIYGGMTKPRYQFDTAEFIRDWGPTPESVEPLIFFAHPGRYRYGEYWDGPWDERWLINIEQMLELDFVLGLEAITYSFGYDDRDLWDAMLGFSAPNRPVIGTSVDDISDLEDADRGWVTFYLSDDEFTPSDQVASQKAIFDAFVSGRTSFSTTQEPGMSAPRIERIERDHDAGRITIEGTGQDVIEWISHGSVVQTGSTIEYEGNDDVGDYVRAQLIEGRPRDPASITCTQAWQFEGD